MALDDLRENLDDVVKGLEYTNNMYAALQDTNGYGIETEWNGALSVITNTKYQGTNPMCYLPMIYEQRIKALCADAFSPTLSQKPLPQRQTCLDDRRELLADMIVTARTMLDITNVLEEKNADQITVENSKTNDMGLNDISMVAGLERIVFKEKAWTRKKIEGLLDEIDAGFAEIDVQVFRNHQSNGNSPFMGHYVISPAVRTPAYTRTIRKPEHKKMLTLQSVGVTPSYRESGLPVLISSLLRRLKVHGLTRFENDMDLAHPAPEKP